MAEKVLLELVMEDGTVRRAVARTQDGLRKIETGSARAEGRVSKLGSAFKAFIAIQIAQRLASTVRGLFDLGTAAEETAAKFSTVFGPATQRLDAELEGLANRMGLTQTEARALTSTVGAVVQGMGFGQEASADFSAELVKLAGDLVSFSNVEGGTERVTQALTSALTGEREALKTLGIVINEADVKQRQAQLAAEGHADALGRQGKATATLELITERAGVAVGDLERTQDSTANTARRVSAEIREQAQTFAQQLLPVYGMVLGALDDLIEKSAGGIAALSRLASEGIFETVAALVEMVKATMLAVEALDDAAGVSIGLGDILSQVKKEINSVTSFMNTMARAAIKAEIFVNDLKAAVLSLSIALRQTRIDIFGGDDSSVKLMRQNLQDLGRNAATLQGDLRRLQEEQDAIGQSTDDWRERMESALESLGDLSSGLTTDFSPALDVTTGKVAAVKTVLDKLQEGVADLRKELAELQAIGPEALGSLLKEKDDLEEQIDRLERFALATARLADAVEDYGASGGALANAGTVSLEGRGLTLGQQSTLDPTGADAFDSTGYAQMADDAEAAYLRVAEANGNLKASFLDLGPAMRDGLGDAVSALSIAVGDLLAGTASIEDVGAAILGTLGDIAVRMGRLLVAFGLSMVGFKKALQTFNGPAAIVTGAALMAAGAAVQSYARSAGNSLGSGATPSTGSTGNLPSASALPASIVLPGQSRSPQIRNTIHVPEQAPAQFDLYIDGEMMTDRVEIVQRRRGRSGRTGGEL